MVDGRWVDGLMGSEKYGVAGKVMIDDQFAKF